MPATARPIPPTAPRQHLGTMALCFYNAPTLDTESADVTVTMKTLLNLLLIEGPPIVPTSVLLFPDQITSSLVRVRMVTV